MTSRGTDRFWHLYAGLPSAIKTAVRKPYGRFRETQAHPGLHLERLRNDPRAWSVRVTLNYRAVARRSGDDWTGFGSARTGISNGSFPRDRRRGARQALKLVGLFNGARHDGVGRTLYFADAPTPAAPKAQLTAESHAAKTDPIVPRRPIPPGVFP